MRLTTKVYLATALVATIGAGAIGSTAVLFSFDTEMSRIRTALVQDSDLIDGTSVDALTDAITVGQASETPISIAYLDSGDRLSQIHDDGLKITKAPTSKQLESGAKAPIAMGEKLMSAVPIITGGYIILQASTAQIHNDFRTNLTRLGLIYAVTLASMILLVWLTLRRDLRSIRRINAAALKIASGDLAANLPEKRGNSEIEGLSKSLRQMVGKLKAAIETEKSSKQAIERFIGDASHELRTPLTVIRGYSELLPNADKKTASAASEKIIREVDKMTALVNDLLLLARLGERRTTELTKVELDSLVQEAFADLQILNPKRPIALKLAEVTIQTDSELINRFLSNVTSNINRYVPVNAEVQVSLSAGRDGVRLVIQDAGPGLPKAAYSEGIRSFKRFDASRSKSAGGTGLGMSLMAGIAENLGGEVTLSKSKLGGLAVTLKLPR